MITTLKASERVKLLRQSVLGDTSASYGLGAVRGNPYRTPRLDGSLGSYRPRYSNPTSLSKAITQYDQLEMIDYSRQLFGQLGNVGAAVTQKADYAVGSAWLPRFTGQSKQWGSYVYDWAKDEFYPACDLRGQPFDFQTNLWLSSVAIDVDGDQLMVKTYDEETRRAKLIFIPSHRVINNGKDVKGGVIEGGPLDGGIINKGIVTNASGKVVGVRVISEDGKSYQDIPAKACVMAYEPEWQSQNRGIPRIVKGLLDWFDIQDIDVFLKRQTKLAASYGILMKNKGGEADTGQDFIDTTVPDEGRASLGGTAPETRRGGEVFYLSTEDDEALEVLKNDNPSGNTAAFVERLERRGILAAGWFIEMLDPSKIGGASVRLIQDLARATVARRQRTLKRIAKAALSFGIAQAMEDGIIPRNDVDPFMWDFTLPPLVTVDSGYDRAADIEELKLGVMTEELFGGKHGRNSYDVRVERKAEIKGILDDARELANEYGITIGAAVDLLYMRSANPAAIETQQEKNDKQESGRRF